MPSTPKIDFNFVNNNVEVSTPQKGVSTVLARTTKGPVLDPSVLITSVTQFKREFGEELVPNGSKSNIEAALERGSKLRIIRVVGPGSTNGQVNTGKPCFTITVDNKVVGVKLTTRRAGEAIGTDKTFSVKFAVVNNTLGYEVVNAGGQPIISGPVFTFKTQDANNNTSVDYLALASWIQNNPYFKVAMVDLDTSGEETTPVSIEAFLNKLAKIDGTSTAISVDIKAATAAGTIGEVETSQPTSAQWIAALEYIKDYTDSYNVIISHLDQHIGNTEAVKVYIALRTILDEINEFRGFIEIPWYDSDGVTVRTLDSIVQLAQQLQSAIGHSKWISYFAGGLKYSNSFGLQQNSDVLGTVLGLADTSATGYGYNYSFAGVNRGVVPDAGGPVVPNFGSPARFKDLETLANNYVNIFVVKDTPSFGKRTLLWHNFTSQVKNDSFRFIGNTGLILNIKKTLRTILESYIEEPNIWNTWSDIYAVVKPIIGNWVDSNAITEPKWMGDQDASSWKDLKVNTEEAVRQGKYHVVFTFKDVVSMQQVTVDVVLEKASKSITMDVNNSTSK
jgi:hypothetical protein